MELETKKKLEKLKYLPASFGGYSIFSPFESSGVTTVSGTFDKVISLLNFAVGFSIVVAVAMIIFAGFMFITAAGDPEKIDKGKNALTAAVVGMVIVFIARMLVLFVLTQFVA